MTTEHPPARQNGRAPSSSSPSPRQVLRGLLASGGVHIVGGAHDPLSARMVEAVGGFEAVWASSYGMSAAALSMPDVDLLTLSETRDIVHRMVLATHLPVVVDCSSGFGSEQHVTRLVAELQRAGAAGISIEDNPYPKRSSLYADFRRTLVPIEEMVRRLEAARRARQDPGLVLVARLESFIAGEPEALALERAAAYVAAGADALIVHGREFEQVAGFARRWKGDAPLIAIPTLYAHTEVSALRDSGFRMVIFPNQAIRGAILGMRRALEAIRAGGTARAADEFIVATSVLDSLVGADSVPR